MMFKVFEFEKELAKIVPTTNEINENTQNYQQLKVSAVTNQYPFLNWSITLNITDSSEYIQLMYPEYFQRLNALMNKTDVKTIKFYIFTRIILQGIWQYMPFYKRNSITGLGGYEANTYTWTHCVNVVLNLLSSDLHLDYLLNHYQEVDASKRYIASMLQNMSLLIQENLSSFDMLSAETISKIQTKMQQVNLIFVPVPSARRTTLSVPDSEDSFLLRAHSALQLKFTRERTKVGYNVYFTHTNWEDMDIDYDEDTNVIGIPIGMTTKLAQTAPGFYIYSTIGFEFAEQLLRVAFGNMNDYYPESWWSASTSSSYYDKWKCFLQQSNANQTIHGLYGTGKTMLSLAAFEKSLLMFRQLVIKNLTKEYRLPNVTLDKEQLYFTKFAQEFCEIEDKNAITTSKDRLNNAVRNNAEFAKTFRCPSGSFMNPRTKCNL